MRIALCVRRSGTVHRLLWLNESSSGIYLGLLGAPEDVHFSYHQDGRRHTKMGDEYVHKSNDVAIEEWRGIRQLQHANMALTPDWLATHASYSGDEKTDTVVLLDDSIFTSGRTFALDVWLLDRASEPQLFELIGKMVDAQKEYEMIAEIVVSLDEFPGHKLALTLRAAPARPQVESAEGAA